MLRLEDCLSQLELTEDEMLAVAEHEGVPAMVALSKSAQILESTDGAKQIYKMIQEDIDDCMSRKHHDLNWQDHLNSLKRAENHFKQSHPECR